MKSGQLYAFQGGVPLTTSMATYAGTCAVLLALFFGMAVFTPAHAQTAPIYAAAIPFDFDDDEIKSTARVKLDGVAAELLGNLNRAEITGYADGALQTETEDRRLSLRRAVAVRTYLIGKGIEEGRLDVFARGDAGSGNVGVRISIFSSP